MREAFLQFVWQQQFMAPAAMVTTTGQQVQVIKQGTLNTYSGPDFSQAVIVLDGITLHGNVEVHYRSSDWYQHHHEQDQSYSQVILHVVWQHNQDIVLPDGSLLPTLTLAGHVPAQVIMQYQHLLQVPDGQLPCGPYLGQVDRLVKIGMLDHALWLRLQRKAHLVLDMLAQNQYDWENTVWQWLAQAYGFKANAIPMLTMAQALHIKTVKRHKDIQRHVEALLLGFAGWLNTEAEDDYHKQLKTDWQWLCHKFSLAEKQMIKSLWKTGGLRPGNGPAQRMVQLAALIHHTHSLQNLLIPHADDVDLKALTEALQAPPTAYWQVHNAPGSACKEHSGAMGVESARLLLINTLAPLWVAYGMHMQQPELTHKAMELLEQIPAEVHAVSKHWRFHQIPQHTAFDTQAGLELKTQFCDTKKCLHCRIGQAIVGRDIPEERPLFLREPEAYAWPAPLPG
jgi:hypothetical protein